METFSFSCKKMELILAIVQGLSHLSLLPLLLELPLLLLLLLDPRLDLRQRLPRERAKGRTVLLGLKQLINTITINCFITYRVTMVVVAHLHRLS